MKKIAALFLVSILLFGLTTASFANTSIIDKNTYQLAQYGEGYFYSEISDSCIIMMAAEPNGDVEFVIKYTDMPDILYTKRIEAEELGQYKFASSDFWEAAKINALKSDGSFASIDASEAVKDVFVQQRASAESQFLTKLSNLYGAEYSYKQIASSTAYLPYTAKVQEFQEFSVEYFNRRVIVVAISVISFVTSLGIPGINLAVASTVLAGILLLDSIYDLITAGRTIESYRIVNMRTRYGAINNVLLTSATLSYVHSGFETGGVVGFDTSATLIYAPSQYDYENTTRLMKDAYDYYRAIYG